MRISCILLQFLIMLFALSGCAQSNVTSKQATTDDGKKVTLYSNGKWVYSDEKSDRDNERNNLAKTVLSNNSCDSQLGDYKCTQSPSIKVVISKNDNGSYLMTMIIPGAMAYKFDGRCEGNKLIINTDGQDVEVKNGKIYAHGFEFIKFN